MFRVSRRRDSITWLDTCCNFVLQSEMFLLLMPAIPVFRLSLQPILIHYPTFRFHLPQSSIFWTKQKWSSVMHRTCGVWNRLIALTLVKLTKSLCSPPNKVLESSEQKMDISLQALSRFLVMHSHNRNIHILYYVVLSGTLFWLVLSCDIVTCGWFLIDKFFS